MNTTTIASSSTVKSLLTNSDSVGYMCVGCVCTPLTLITLVVLFSNRNLLQKSALIVGFTFGNLFLGLYLLTNGAYRLAFANDLQKPATFNYCLSIILPFFYPLAFNMEAAFLILSGVERILAIKEPHWFRQRWTDRFTWYLTLDTLILVLVVSMAGLFLPVDRPSPIVMCGLPNMYGSGYMLYLSGFAAIGGAISTLLTAFALVAGIRHIQTLPLASGESGRVRRQIQLTKSMVTISCIDIGLVVIPNILSLLVNSGVQFPSWIRGANSSYTHGVNAMVEFFAFLAFHSQFRKAAIKLFRAQKLAPVLGKVFGIGATVHPTMNLPSNAIGSVRVQK